MIEIVGYNGRNWVALARVQEQAAQQYLTLFQGIFRDERFYTRASTTQPSDILPRGRDRVTGSARALCLELEDRASAQGIPFLHLMSGMIEEGNQQNV